MENPRRKRSHEQLAWVLHPSFSLIIFLMSCISSSVSQLQGNVLFSSLKCEKKKSCCQEFCWTKIGIWKKQHWFRWGGTHKVLKWASFCGLVLWPLFILWSREGWASAVSRGHSVAGHPVGASERILGPRVPVLKVLPSGCRHQGLLGAAYKASQRD